MNIPEAPTQSDIDRAREALERANFKLGKARAQSITSTAQAASDAQDLQACVDLASQAENYFAQVTDRFINRARRAAVAPAAEASAPTANPPMADANAEVFDRTAPGAAA